MNVKKISTVLVLVIIAGVGVFFLHRLQTYIPSVTGPLVASDNLWDGEYIQPLPYAVLYRKSEMYSWIETKTQENGTTTYAYREDWQEKPISAVFFNNFKDHYNPPKKAIQSRMIISTTTSINNYHIDLARARFGTLLPVALNAENTIQQKGITLVDANFLYKSVDGKSDYQHPHIGDVRVSYTGLPLGSTTTILGKIEGAAVIPYIDHGQSVYYLSAGDRTTTLLNYSNQ